MIIPYSSRESRFGRRPTLQHRSFMGAMFVLGVVACSSDDRTPNSSPSALSPSPEQNDPNAAADRSGDGAQGGSTTEDTPSASEGPQVSNVAPPDNEPGTGGSNPTTPVTDDGKPEAGAAVPSVGCGKARTLQDGNQTIASGGMNRTYFLETPDAYDETYPHRVVFMFHWNYGSIGAIVNPPDADRNTDRPFYGMGDLTDGQTIFVVPQGLVGASGGAGWENPNNRDVNFTDDMLTAISGDLCIDTSRVFTTGFSYGAGMSVALACVRSDKFRAAVVYAPAFISGVSAAECTTPVAFFESHGVDDPIINYQQTGLNVLNTFTSLNGCTAMTPAVPPADGHTCTSYEGCSVPTRFCSFGAGEGNPFNVSLRGHYPTSKDPGQSTSWVPAEAWSFITQF